MKLFGIALLLLVVGLLAVFGYFDRIANPRVVRELLADPVGERAGKVMLITLPSGRRLPVNYLREEQQVYAGADGRWWKELVGGPHPVKVWIRGETFDGRARAVVDDPATTKDVFARLRPKAIPGFGTLVEIHLDAAENGESGR